MLTENFPGLRKVTKCSILPQSRSLSCNSDVHLHSLAPESLNFPDHFDKNIKPLLLIQFERIWLLPLIFNGK